MRAIRTLAIVLAAAAAMTLLAAWLVPPLLDWNRYRDTIGAIAASRLGRPVEIGGGITVRLFPEAVVTASNVTLPDRGDGISAELGALRLQVALRPLLAGRIVARDLVLGAPVLHLPWPLPAAIANPPRPLVPAGFNAMLEDGVLAIGAIQFTGINATLRADTVTGALAAGGSLSAAGRPWRFQGKLDPAAGNDGAPIALHVRGEGSLGADAGDFTGRLSDASLTGTLDAKGDDFDHALPRLPGGWAAHARLALTRGTLDATDIAIASVQASARASATLSLAGPPRLSVKITTPRLDAAWWWPTIAPQLSSLAGRTEGNGTGQAQSGLPFELTLSADELALLGDTLHHATLAVSDDGTGVRVSHAEAEPPGGGTVSLSGPITMPGALAHVAAGDLAIAGPFRLETARPAKLLAWLDPMAPALVHAASALAAMAPVDRPASLAGTLALSPGQVAMTGLAGSIAGQMVSGDIAFSGLQTFPEAAVERPRVAGHLQIDHLVLDPFIPASLTAAVPDLEALAGFDADLRISAPTAQAGTMDFTDLLIDAHDDADGLTLRRAAAELAGAHLSASGNFVRAATSAGWSIGSGKIAIATQDAGALRDTVPPGWRFVPALWRGAADAELSVAGPSTALNLQLSADAGDLRVEAETLADAEAGTATTTLTLRHPGAPRLLGDLGIPHADTWLGTGSMALLLHAASAPDRLTIQDFALAAAELRLHGRADLEQGTAAPTVDAHVEAKTLALPGVSSWPEIERASLMPAGWANGLAGHLHLAAEDVLVGGQNWVSDLMTDVVWDRGMMLADTLTANVLGGSLAAQIALSPGAVPPRIGLRATLAGAALSGPLTGLPIDPLTGSFDATLAAEGPLTSGKQPWQNLTGTFEVALQDTTFGGLDLGRLSRTYANADPAQSDAELHAGTTSGVSAGLAGSIDLDFASGKATIRQSTLAGADGALTIDGSLAPDAQTADLHVTASPNGDPAPPPIKITLDGVWTTAKPKTDLTQAQAWITNAAKQNQPPPQPPDALKSPSKRRVHKKVSSQPKQQ